MGSLSVAICTHNRAGSLEQVLASFCTLLPPKNFDWQLVVVLNACTDTSAEIVRAFCDRLPLVVAVEERPGLSRARNRAVGSSKGDFIVFVDDDVRVEPGFLRAYEAAFQKWSEDDVFSGPVMPTFEPKPPDWLLKALPVIGSAFGRQVVERDGAPITRDRLPYGANFAIRRTAQERLSYDSGLGRGAVDWLRGGEETVLLEKVLAGGSSGRWVAAAAVDHVIGPDRQTFDYLWRYYEGYGAVTSILASRQEAHRRIGSMLGSLAEMVVSELAFRIAYLFAKESVWAPLMVRAAVRRGRWKGRRLV